jgi:hypothetical protein
MTKIDHFCSTRRDALDQPRCLLLRGCLWLRALSLTRDKKKQRKDNGRLFHEMAPFDVILNRWVLAKNLTNAQFRILNSYPKKTGVLLLLSPDSELRIGN